MHKKILAVFLAMLLLTACMIQPVLAGPYDPAPDSGGGSAPPPPPPEPTPVTSLVKTEDDRTIDNSIRTTGTAVVNLGTQADDKAELSPAVVNQLIEEGIPLTIKNQGVKVEFPGQALNTNLVSNNLNNETARVEIGAEIITPQQQQEIIARTPLGESTGIFTVGSVIIDLSAAVVTSSGSTEIDSFNEPVAVTIDLSGVDLTPEMINELCGTRLEVDANGNIVPVRLGGTYDPVTKQFTFYTDKFSYYTVMRVKNLINVVMFLGSRVATFNGVSKTMDVEPILFNNRSMVPLRYIGEALGASFTWNEKTRMVTFTKDGKQLSLIIDKLQPGLDTPAIIRNSRTLVPIRYIAESFGAQVNWIPSTQKIEVIK